MRPIAAVALALASAVPGPLARAQELGPLTAQSVRGEPLHAVVELRGYAASREVSVRLATPEAYARFGLSRDPALADAALRTAIEPDGKRFVRVSTIGPVRASELVLLLEADGAGRRAYRVPLGSDEPASRVNLRGVEPIVRAEGAVPMAAGEVRPTRDAGAVASSGPASATGTPGVGMRPATPSAARTDAAPAAEIRADGAPAAEIRADAVAMPIASPARPVSMTVASDDTLESIAAALRPPGATLEQSAVALWRANRAAFVGRPARARVGATIDVPPEAAVLALAPDEARRIASAFAAPAETPSIARAPQPQPPIAATEPTERRDVVRTPRTVARPIDPEIEATLRRTRELARRITEVRAGFESTFRREEAMMTALIDATRRRSEASVRGSDRSPHATARSGATR